MKASVLELSNLIQGFKLSCQTEGKSPKTIEWYISFLLRFLKFLEQNGLPTQLDHIEKTHIRQFILYLQQEARTSHKHKPLSGATVQGYVNKEMSPEAFLAYFEILRKGVFASSDLLANTARNAEFARDLVSLIHYGLMGKPQ